MRDKYQLRNDLTEKEKAFAENEIKSYKKQFGVANIDNITYCKKQPIIGEYDDFGAVSFFFCVLVDLKKYFSRLEYYDLGKNRKSVAI